MRLIVERACIFVVALALLGLSGVFPSSWSDDSLSLLGILGGSMWVAAAAFFEEKS